MRKFFSAICKFIKKAVRELYLFSRGIFSAFKNASQPSYYPELPRKCFASRVFDGVKWAFSRRSDNRFYTGFGFDIKGHFSNKKEYVDENRFWAQLKIDNKFNFFSQIPILRDKYCFYSFLKSNDIPTPKVFALKIGDNYYDSESFSNIDEDFFKKRNDYFVKDINGECASYVKHINDFQEFEKAKKDFEENKIDCIFQERLIQNETISKLYAGSINTLRIVTINDSNSIRILTSVLRVGTKETGSVDNWAKGGYAIGIDEFGRLKKYGYKKPSFGLKEEKHQDTKIVFNGFEIPYFKEACRLCIKAHSLFYTLGSIGWDVAITTNGPVLIEGNDNFEISFPQMCNGGLKKEWDNHIRLRTIKNK